MPFTLSGLSSNKAPGGGFSMYSQPTKPLFDPGKTVGPQGGGKAASGGGADIVSSVIGVFGQLASSAIQADAASQVQAQKTAANARQGLASAKGERLQEAMRRAGSSFRLGG